MKYLLTMLLGLLILSSCNSDPIEDLSIQESQVYITNRDKSVDFTQFKTFSIPDSVYIYGNQGSSSSSTPTDIAVLTRVIHQLKALGYQQVTNDNNPDIGVSVQLVNNMYYNIVQTPIGGSWGGGYWGGYSGWGMGYPSYYSYQRVQDIYWVMNILDLKHPDTANKKLKVIWNAQIQGNGIYDSQYTDLMIDKVFEQSPYLKTN